MDLCQIVTTNVENVNTSEALITCVKDELIAIPLPSIISIEDVAASEISLVDSDDVIYLRGRVIPLLYLDKLFNFVNETEKKDKITAVICSHNDSYVGLVVDDLLGQQEIESKPLGILSDNKLFTGASILSDNLAMILDVPALIA
jgi:two-component system chemotaxis sensor kinase CheA